MVFLAGYKIHGCMVLIILGSHLKYRNNNNSSNNNYNHNNKYSIRRHIKVSITITNNNNNNITFKTKVKICRIFCEQEYQTPVCTNQKTLNMKRCLEMKILKSF